MWRIGHLLHARDIMEGEETIWADVRAAEREMLEESIANAVRPFDPGE